LLESQFGNGNERRLSPLDRFSEIRRRSATLTDPLIRFGKRSSTDAIDGDLEQEVLSPLIRFGKRASSTADMMIRFGRRADERPRIAGDDTMLRFGRR